MTKEEFIAKVADSTGQPKTVVNKVLKTMIDTVSDTLAAKDSVSFVGFGKFEVATRQARKGRNPRTGKELRIPEAVVPKFKAGKKLRDAVKSPKKAKAKK